MLSENEKRQLEEMVNQLGEEEKALLLVMIEEIEERERKRKGKKR